MRYFGSVWRAVLWACASLVILCLVAGATIRVRLYILRHRAEMLLADMESISLRQTTFRDVQRISVRWRRWGKYDGPCSEAHCTFDIVLSDSDTPLNQFLRQHATAFALATYLGAPPAAIRAHLTVIDGIVWSESIGFGIEVQQQNSDGRRYVDLIGGAASSVSKLNPWFWGSHWHLHPDYSIWSANKFKSQLQLQFTPFANPASLVTADLSTGSGLHLGQTSTQVRARLGKPSFSSDDKIAYFFSVKKKTPAPDFETLKKQNPQMTQDELHRNYDFYTLGVYIQARFLSDKLVYLGVSKTESR